MSFQVIFWDSVDQKLSLGNATVDVVPSVGDTVSIFAANGSTRGEVKARHWRVDDLNSGPAPHAPYVVDVILKR